MSESYVKKILSNYPSDISDSLMYEANSYMYFFGDHFMKSNLFKKKCKSLFLKLIFNFFYYLFKIVKVKFSTSNCEFILSNAYFDLASFLKLNFNIVDVPWQITNWRIIFSDIELYFLIYKIRKSFEMNSLNVISSPEFLNLVLEYEELFKSYLLKNKVKSIIVSLDIPFFEAISISCAKKLGIPTFLFLHGLPARYNCIDDNRTEFLLVWGKAIKINYLNKGFSPDKIFVVGHPIYSKIRKKELKSSLDNILVLTKAMCGTPHSDQVRLMDRSNSLLYLELIKENLLGLGVKSVRLRCHPSENPYFYKKHLADEFYVFDFSSKEDTLQNSSLIIGPSSTMVLDSLNYGINYILFEPLIGGKTLTGFDVVPPFDGNSFISRTDSLESFKFNVISENNIKWDLFNDYVDSSFSLEFVSDILKSSFKEQEIYN
jgi:hypothetical protein